MNTPLATHFATLPSIWREWLSSFIMSSHCQTLCQSIDVRSCANAIYPRAVFAALHHTPPEQVKVVILGQDPYHGTENGVAQAHGLAFSVASPLSAEHFNGQRAWALRAPPSLRNVFKALQKDLGIAPPDHGDLTPWADQGVLLLNTVLTVNHQQPGSHRGLGWEAFTDLIIQELAKRLSHCVFLLWGNDAQTKASLIAASGQPHAVLTAPHPSPLSAHRGFLTCRHFSQTNQYLTAHQRTPIHWALPPSNS